jgi:5-methylcytosine-specific restriction endonuclease McrA
MPRSTCKSCMKAKRKVPRVHWLAKVCTGCRQMVPLSGYYFTAGAPHMPCKACRVNYQPPAVPVSEKRCSNCKQVKPASAFTAAPKHIDRLDSQCRICRNAHRPAVIVIPTEKRCSVCKIMHPADDFYRTDKSPDGLYSCCKDCHNQRAYAGQRLYKAQNIEQVRKWNNGWRKKHPEHGQRNDNIRRARKKNAPIADFTREQWLTMKAAYRGCCAYCGKKTRLTIDHVIPLAQGGGHTASNIVPACKSCNSKKHTREAPSHQRHLFV